MILHCLVSATGCNRDAEPPDDRISRLADADSTNTTANTDRTNGGNITPRSEERIQPASHLRMLEELDAIRERAADDNVYLGDKPARNAREDLARLADDAPTPLRVEKLIGLGFAELVIGNEEPAIKCLTDAYDLLPQAQQAGLPPSLRNRVLFLLGVAYMRLAETENCCARSSPDNCIIPIADGGIHTEQRGARMAVRYLSQLFRSTPRGTLIKLDSRWLLNIAHMTLGEYPDAVPREYLIPQTAFSSSVSFPKFVNISADVGLDTFSLSGGVVCDDIDNDGYLDLFVSTWDTAGQIQYFRNNGDGSFSNNTIAAGLEGLFGGLNLLQADYNNDGHVDILVLRGAWLFEQGQHPNSLLRNNGDGTFSDVTFDAGLGEVNYPTQTASWADYDLDGDVDLFIGNESTERLEAPCQLFQNNGNGSFSDVAKQAGVQNMRFTKSVIWGDYDGDRDPDLYVSNLTEPNRLYRNNGDGSFTDVAEDLGVSEPQGSFPAWFWDVNNDGDLDLFVSSYTAQIGHLAAAYMGLKIDNRYMPRLYVNQGGGEFEEVSAIWGLRQPSAPMGSNFGDLDGDGYLDFYLGTGDPHFKNIMPNLMYRNVDGRRFVDVTMAGGFGHLQKGHAVVFADLDHDGDQDVFEQLGGAYLGDKFKDALFENPGFGHRWIAIQLVGQRSNRSAIGTRIHIEVIENGQSRSIYRWVNSGATFGGSPLRQHIGLGNADAIRRIEIFWPMTGKTQTLLDAKLNSFVRVVENQAEFETINLKSFRMSKN